MRNICLILFVAMSAAMTRGEDWPQWRGPLFTGASPERNLPSEWSKTNQVAWSYDLPGPSAATPVVWDNHVFVPSTDLEKQTLVALALDRATGKQLWQDKTGNEVRHDRQSTYSSSSPVTDGQRVIFFFSTGDLVAFDFAGHRLWARNIQTDYGTFAFQWTFSSSPLLFEGKLYLEVLQRNEPVRGRGRAGGPIDSYLLAMDPASGKTLWQQVRPSEAVAESHEAYSTPIPFVYDGRKELLVVGGDCLTGHDPATGKELWRWGTWNAARIGHWRMVPSPVAGDGIILACAPKGSPVYGIKAGLSGGLGDDAIAWKTDRQGAVSADVPTPLFYQGDFFILNDLRKNLSRLEARTGRVKWTVPTPGQAKYEASPAGGDGKIYLQNFKGETTVVDAENGTVLRTIPMGEEGDDMTRSSIAISHEQLFIRTNHKLFCVGKSGGQ